MKRIFLLAIISITIFFLSGCNFEQSPDSLRDSIIDKIDFYINANDYIDLINDESLIDVDEKREYIKDDFFNYDSKSPLNVELEYGEFHSSFSNLIFVKDAISDIEDFRYDSYFKNSKTDEMVLVNYEDGELYLDFYETLPELEVIIRHNYILNKVDEEAQMIKYLSVYDTETDEIIISKIMKVFGDRYTESIEYYPTTNSFTYLYNSKEDQDYFKYKGILTSDNYYLRQTVEYYIDEHNSFVSYDIKEDLLEDYRVKIFDEGHRIVKIDVNTFKNDPSINELTWNLLEVDGWDSVDYYLGEHFVYRNSISTMMDYEIDIQLNGYGKIIAYKLFEGDLSESDITLSEYGLNSGLTLQQAYDARDHFINNYRSELVKYGFTVNDVDNLDILLDIIDEYIEDGVFDEYIKANK